MRYLLWLLLVAPLSVSAQASDAPAQRTHPVAEVVDVMPELELGLAELLGRLGYPADAEARRIEGRVLIGFVVTEEGTVIDAEVVEGVHPSLDRAALEAIRTSRFRPGSRNGEVVSVRMALPITFSLPTDG